jgi:hypothetical protein
VGEVKNSDEVISLQEGYSQRIIPPTMTDISHRIKVNIIRKEQLDSDHEPYFSREVDVYFLGNDTTRALVRGWKYPCGL